eukprot:984354-Pyramimonas_sp.AAC.1
MDRARHGGVLEKKRNKKTQRASDARCHDTATWVGCTHLCLRRLLTDQSDAGSADMFSRRTNQPLEARVYSHDGPIRRTSASAAS